MENYSQCITSLVLHNYTEAYNYLKLSKSEISSVNYYDLKLRLLKHLNLKDKISKNVDKLILLNNITFDVRNNYLNLLSEYIQQLPFIKKIKLDCPTPDNYRISTPCIRKIQNVFYCNMRAINYIYTNTGDYISRDSDGIVRTINFIVKLDTNFNIQDMFKVAEAEDVKIFPCHVMGMEDIRLIDNNYFLCTRLDVTKDHHPKMCLYNYNKDTSLSCKVLDYNNMGTEKNWLPLFSDDNCKIIYSFDPLIIYNLNLDTGELIPYINKKISEYNLTSFRGSAVPIIYNNGWLMTIHQVYYHKLRKYYHRFVWLSQDFTSIKISQPFYFDKIGVEFNLGLAELDDHLILTYSVDDSNPSLLTIDKNTVDDMLYSISV